MTTIRKWLHWIWLGSTMPPPRGRYFWLPTDKSADTIARLEELWLAESTERLRLEALIEQMRAGPVEEIQFEGYSDLWQNLRAYRKGNRICIVGTPMPRPAHADNEDYDHNCDRMGCPSTEHVVARFSMPEVYNA